jgi:hypothetical protein
MKTVIRAAIGAVVIAVVVLALVLSCPDEANFKRWAKRSLKRESGSVTEKAKGQALSTEARWTADYESHVLWATVDAYQGTAKQRYVGIAGTWFRVSAD